MHELSIALAIIEAVETEFIDQVDITVKSVKISVGSLTTIVPEALQFAWSEAVKGTVLAGAVLEILLTDGLGYCKYCEQDSEIFEFKCKICGHLVANAKGGDELLILSVQL